MTVDNYLKEHIPHRINLLVTFRDRFKDLSDDRRENVRDLFRCSKDISMLMARFLLGELGIKLKKNDAILSPEKDTDWKKRISDFNLKTLNIDNIRSNTQLNYDILTILKAANRAVAHIHETDVNHEIKTKYEEPILIRVIDFTEKAIKTNFYESTGFDFDAIMTTDCNEMHRERLRL